MNDDNQPVTGPLHGLRVIDWTMWQFGPVSTMMLADMGAEVIKIESLDGDHGRHFESIRGRRAELEGDLSAYFEGMNRQKLGMALNLKTPSGVLIMHRLVRQSDVLVQNFRKGVKGGVKVYQWGGVKLYHRAPQDLRRDTRCVRAGARRLPEVGWTSGCA